MPNQGISAIVGRDSLIIGGQVITGLADGDAIKLEPNGPVAAMKVSKDGNSIYAMQYSGIVVKLTIRLVRGCLDDITLNGQLQSWISNPTGFQTLAGSYVKAIGDGKGNIINEVYTLAGGIFESIPGGMQNMDGNTEQAVTVYTLLFRNDARLQS